VKTLTGHPNRPNPFGDRVDVASFDFDDRRNLAEHLRKTVRRRPLRYSLPSDVQLVQVHDRGPYIEGTRRFESGRSQQEDVISGGKRPPRARL
jgi:hypothetical protein